MSTTELRKRLIEKIQKTDNENLLEEAIWSLRAQNDRKEILNYWRLRNKSNADSKKLNELIKQSIKLIIDFP